MTIHETIVETIKRDIRSGRLKPGDKLPSIAQLREQHHCAYGTVRYAMIALKAEGLTVGHQGKGSYVARRLS